MLVLLVIFIITAPPAHPCGEDRSPQGIERR